MVRHQTCWKAPVVDSLTTCQNVSNCQSSGFHAGIGSLLMSMVPLKATAMTA